MSHDGEHIGSRHENGAAAHGADHPGPEIDERRRIEEILAQSERDLAEAQRVARVGNWNWDIEKDEVSWSTEMYRILGYDPESDKPSRGEYLERVHPEDRPLVEGRIAALMTANEPFDIDHRIVLPDGSIRYLHSMARVEWGPDEKPVRLFGIAQDITERKEYEEELQLKNRAIESSISGIGITNLEGRMIYANDSLVRMWGYDSRDEILGRFLPDFWEGEGIAKTVQELRTNGFSTGEDIGKKKDGSTFPVEYSASMLTDGQGNPVSMYGSFVDITEKVRAREELLDLGARLIHAQEEERSRIARELHDDVSQRLALLGVELEWAAQNSSGSDPELIEKMRELFERVKELSTDIHDLSYRLHPRSLERLGLAVAIRSLCREINEYSELTVVFEDGDVPESLPIEVALCLYRVAQESLRNAIDHSGSENVVVELGTEQGTVQLSVTDSGSGFEPDSVGGQGGLGIISMRERLRALGGHLTFHSPPGEGTRVEAVVPFEPTDQARSR